MGRFHDRYTAYMAALWPDPYKVLADPIIHDNTDDDFANMIVTMTKAKQAVIAANKAIRKYERKHKPVKTP